MPVYKDKNGTWFVSCCYDDWQSNHSRKVKRGFPTKREAQEWERKFLDQGRGDLDMTFAAT